MKRLLRCLEDAHASQVCSLLKVLADYFLDSHCRSVTRMVEGLICRRLEAALASFQQVSEGSKHGSSYPSPISFCFFLFLKTLNRPLYFASALLLLLLLLLL